MELNFFRETSFFLGCVYYLYHPDGEAHYLIYMTPPKGFNFPFIRTSIVSEEARLSVMTDDELNGDMYVKVVEVSTQNGRRVSKCVSNIKGKTLLKYEELGGVIQRILEAGGELAGGLGNCKEKLEITYKVGLPYMYSLSSFDGGMKEIKLK